MPYRPSKPLRISVGRVYAKARSDLVEPLTHTIKAPDFHYSSVAISPQLRKTGYGEDVRST